jgi:hypothetical protein
MLDECATTEGGRQGTHAWMWPGVGSKRHSCCPGIIAEGAAWEHAGASTPPARLSILAAHCRSPTHGLYHTFAAVPSSKQTASRSSTQADNTHHTTQQDAGPKQHKGLGRPSMGAAQISTLPRSVDTASHGCLHLAASLSVCTSLAAAAFVVAVAPAALRACV